MYDKLKTSLFATDSKQLRKLTTWLGYVSSFWNTCTINAFVNHNKNIVFKFQSLILTQLKVGCRISFSKLSEVVLTLCLELCELNWLWILSMDFYNRCWLHKKLPWFNICQTANKHGRPNVFFAVRWYLRLGRGLMNIVLKIQTNYENLTSKWVFSHCKEYNALSFSLSRRNPLRVNWFQRKWKLITVILETPRSEWII